MKEIAAELNYFCCRSKDSASEIKLISSIFTPLSKKYNGLVSNCTIIVHFY
jgi:hypothetical protein